MTSTTKSFVARLMNEEQGATLVEYILLVALIAIVCIIGITAVGGKASAKLDNVANNLN